MLLKILNLCLIFAINNFTLLSPHGLKNMIPVSSAAQQQKTMLAEDFVQLAITVPKQSNHNFCGTQQKECVFFPL